MTLPKDVLPTALKIKAAARNKTNKKEATLPNKVASFLFYKNEYAFCLG